MKLQKLLETIKEYIVDTKNIDDIDIDYISYDSRDIIPNTLFVVKGQHFKIEYLEQAINKGASVIISQEFYDVDIPVIIVNNIRNILAPLAKQFYQYDLNSLKITGITGTKGKSSTTYFLKNIIDCGIKKKSAFLSSINSYDGTVEFESHLTTPEPFELFKHLYNASNCNCQYLTMEVSSQALKMKRCSTLNFDIGVFLNIDNDHISENEHSDFEDYLSSKLLLVQQSKKFVLNLDLDLHGHKISHNHLITFSKLNQEADYYVHDIQALDNKVIFKLNDEVYQINMLGTFNVDNVAAAIICAKEYGFTYEQIYQGIISTYVPGRMNYHQTKDKKVTIIVDYAHNGLSFNALLSSIRYQYNDYNIYIVYGCPGNKAKNRRSELSYIVNKYADKAYICMEDPGYEDPSAIAREVVSYLTIPNEIIHDRQQALLAAVKERNTDRGTIILFTGKGEETRQKILDQYVDTVSDEEIAKMAINDLDSGLL